MPSWALMWVACVSLACAGAAHAQSRLCQSYSGMPAAVSSAKSDSNKVPAGMVAIKGGSFVMGSDRFYPEERPRETVAVGPFYIQQHEVTNAQFAAFRQSHRLRHSGRKITGREAVSSIELSPAKSWFIGVSSTAQSQRHERRQPEVVMANGRILASSSRSRT